MTYNSNKDYCTSSPDELFGYTWGEICKIHDEDYAAGGNSMVRKEADIKLRKGINSKLPFLLKWIGWIYYFFVRVFGRGHWNGSK